MPLKRDRVKVLKSSQILSYRDLLPFKRVALQLGERNDQDFYDLLNTGSELTLIPRNLKKYCGPPAKLGA